MDMNDAWELKDTFSLRDSRPAPQPTPHLRDTAVLRLVPLALLRQLRPTHDTASGSG